MSTVLPRPRINQRRIPTCRNRSARTLRNSTFKFARFQFIKKEEGCVREAYDIGDLIGSGTFGDVYACQHRESDTERAIKVVPKSDKPAENRQVINELNILTKMDHPNILHMYGFFEDDQNFYLVSDIYRGGELFQKIQESGPLSEKDAAQLLISLLSCMTYCHETGMVHRDLKPENILLDDSKNMDDIKVIDFGIARASSHSGHQTEVFGGTPAYYAPEVLEGRCGPKNDVWACGMIAFVVLGGYVPFMGTEEEILEQVAIGHVSFDYSVWDNVSQLAKDFIEFLLNPDESKRPTAKTALKHPWLHGRRNSLEKSSMSLRHLTTESLENIQLFNPDSKLKQAVCAFMASQMLSKEDKSNIDRVFRAIDLDGNGRLDRQEVVKAFRTHYGIELSKRELDGMFSRVDFDGNGTIEYSEFSIASMLKRKLMDQKMLRQTFDAFDTNGDGSIDKDELRVALKMGGEWEDYIVNKVIKEVDLDGDGEISFEEFCQNMCRVA